eukprot:80651-Amphidinium_carterae.1
MAHWGGWGPKTWFNTLPEQCRIQDVNFELWGLKGGLYRAEESYLELHGSFTAVIQTAQWTGEVTG